MDRHTLLNRGAHAYATGRLAEAEAFYLTILAATPRDPETLSNLAAVRNGAQCHEAAEATCRAALALQPGFWPALANLGTALHGQQRHEDAVDAYYAALRANPGHASSWTNLGVALNEMQAMPDALLAHDTAAKLAPNDAQIRANRAMGLLMAGDYVRGFAEFEWRWATPGMAPHGMAAPAWDGSDPCGADDPAALRGGVWGYDPVYPLCAAARGAGRGGDCAGADAFAGIAGAQFSRRAFCR